MISMISWRPYFEQMDSILNWKEVQVHHLAGWAVIIKDNQVEHHLCLEDKVLREREWDLWRWYSEDMQFMIPEDSWKRSRGEANCDADIISKMVEMNVEVGRVESHD